MSTTPEITAVAEAVKAEIAVAAVAVKRLSKCGSPAGCQNTFWEGEGFVPSFDYMNNRLFGGPGTLTREQVLAFEVCRRCSKMLPTRGLSKFYPTFGALRHMAEEKAERERRIAKHRVEQEKLREAARRQEMARRLYGSARPPRERSNIGFVPPPAREYVDETFEKFAVPAEEADKPAPQHRTHHKVAPAFRSDTKKYGDERKHVVAAKSKKQLKKEAEEARAAKKRGR